MAKKKIVLSIEILGLILVIVLALIGFYINSNDKEVRLLNNEIGRLKDKNENLEAELDPNWHSKFNNQRQYYEAELGGKDKELMLLKIETDSLIKIKNFLKRKDLRDLIYSLQVVDSLILAYERELETTQQLINSQNNIMRLDSSMRKNLELLVQTSNARISNLQELIDINSRYDIVNKIILGINIILLVLIIVSYFNKKRDENKSKVI